MPNPFAHIELNTDDVGKAKKFYARLFQWKLGAMGPDYTIIDVGKGGTGGGMQKKAVLGSPTLWLPYVQVDDVKKTIAKARKLGADIQVDHLDIGEMGSIGVFLDPTGAPLGVWALPRAPKQSTAQKASARTKKKTKKKTKKQPKR